MFQKYKQLLLPVILILAASSAQSREVDFSWEPFEGVLGYEIRVGKKPNFKEVVFKKKTKEPSIKVDLEMGTYYYKVRAIDKQKRAGHWSRPMKVVVTPYPPELELPKNATALTFYEVPPKIRFEWKKREGDPTYDVFVYKTTGEKILETKTTDNFAEIDKLIEGEYMWKVRTIYKKIYISPYGEPRRFGIERLAFKKPELVKPIKEVAKPAYRPIVLEWRKDEAAKLTDIEITPVEPGTNQEKVKSPKNIEGTTYEIPYIEPGKYKWKVTTKEAEDTPGVTTKYDIFDMRRDLPDDDSQMFSFGTSYYLWTSQAESTRRGSAETHEMETSAFTYNLDTLLSLGTGARLALELQGGDFEIDGARSPFYKQTMALHLGFGLPGFQQYFLFGYRRQSLYEVLDGAINRFSADGPIIGMRIGGTVSNRWRVLLQGVYFKPLSHSENLGDLTGDVYDVSAVASWNFYYKFWLNYKISYGRSVMFYTPDPLQKTLKTKWEGGYLEPLMLSLSFEH